LGQGAFATVFKCTRLADNKDFAVKVFDKESINKNSKSQLYKRALAKEILVMRLINSNYTSRLLEVYESETNLYLV
jgi:serine/threonine protein kinase